MTMAVITIRMNTGRTIATRVRPIVSPALDLPIPSETTATSVRIRSVRGGPDGGDSLGSPQQELDAVAHRLELRFRQGRQERPGPQARTLSQRRQDRLTGHRQPTTMLPSVVRVFPP